MANLKEVRIKTSGSEKKSKLPKGATIIDKDITVNVREIENGFIIKKTYDIKYMIDDDTKYLYYDKEWYSKDDPMMTEEGKSLADMFKEE